METNVSRPTALRRSQRCRTLKNNKFSVDLLSFRRGFAGAVFEHGRIEGSSFNGWLDNWLWLDEIESENWQYKFDMRKESLHVCNSASGIGGNVVPFRCAFCRVRGNPHGNKATFQIPNMSLCEVQILADHSDASRPELLFLILVMSCVSFEEDVVALSNINDFSVEFCGSGPART